MNYSLFIRRTIIISMSLVLGLLAFNSILDPYDISPARVTISRINKIKPSTDNFGRLHKSFQSIYSNSQVLILGNSRIDRGVDPANYPDIRAYNGSYPGAIPHELFANLKTAYGVNSNLKVVFIGVDLMMFNHLRNPSQTEFSVSGDRPLSIYYDAFTKFIKMNLSWDTLIQSLSTLKYNFKNAHGLFYSKLGHFAFFDHSPINDAQLNSDQLLRTYASETDVFKDYKISKPSLAGLKEIVTFCRQNSLQLKIFIAPTHPTMQELIFQLGLWPTWETWKRNLVEIAPIYDYSTYDQYTTEPIKKQMEYFYEVAHFKPALGRILMRDLLNPTESLSLITKKNVDEKLRAHAEKHRRWRHSNLRDSERVGFILSKPNQ